MNSTATTLDAHRSAVDELVARAAAAHRAAQVALAAEDAALAAAHALGRELGGALPRSSSRETDMVLRDIAARIATEVRMSDRTIQRRMDAATNLTMFFPETFAAWTVGEIDRGHVSAIVDAGITLPDEAREWFERLVVQRARELSPRELGVVAGTLAEHAHPESLQTRHERARLDRGIRIEELSDGMARLIADVPAVIARGILDRLTSMAHAVRAAVEPEAVSSADAAETEHCDAGALFTESRRVSASASAPNSDPRLMDELRADIFADLLLGGGTVAHGDGLDAITAHVQVNIPVMTTLGHSEEPVILAGHGPIPLDTALRLAGTATGWDRVLTDPVHGTVMHTDRYRPTAGLRRHLRVRDEHCRFPGCRMAPWRSDNDHTVDHAHGGATRADNLAVLCRRHHMLKHHTAWGIEHLGRGKLRWTSPTGNTYIDKPAAMVRFVGPDDLPPGTRSAGRHPAEHPWSGEHPPHGHAQTPTHAPF